MKRTLATLATTVVMLGGAAGVAAYTIAAEPAAVADVCACAPASPDDANRDAARAEAQHLIDEAPLPAGAATQESAPTPILVHEVQGGPLEQDTTLDRVAWWTVPVSTDDFAAYVAGHVPTDLTPGVATTGTEGNTKTGVSVSWAQQDFTGTGTDAYTTPELWVIWTAYHGGTAVRAEAYIGARWPRAASSYITGRIERVDVRLARTPDRFTGPREWTIVSYAGRRPVQRLRAAFNRLHGSIHNEGQGLARSCPAMMGLPDTTTLVFHLPHGHSMRVRDISYGCGDRLQAWRDGRRVSPPLDPSGFAAAVAAIAK